MKTSKEQTEKTIDSVEKMMNCGYINDVSYKILKYELGVLMQSILVEEKNNTTKTDALKRISNAHSETWSAQIARDSIDETRDLLETLKSIGLCIINISSTNDDSVHVSTNKNKKEIRTIFGETVFMTNVDDVWVWNKMQRDFFINGTIDKNTRGYLLRTLLPQLV